MLPNFGRAVEQNLYGVLKGNSCSQHLPLMN